jgi:hypothetical protein
MSVRKRKPAEWAIRGGGCGAWFAWNQLTGERVGLGWCSFADAVELFERKIGDYYGTRGKHASMRKEAGTGA